MKIHAKLKTKIIDSENHAHLNFYVTNFRQVSYLDELESDVEYSLEIKKVKSKRSMQQNKLLWAMLHLLEIETKELAIDWYIKALVDTGAVVDYIWVAQRIEDTIKKSFRALQRVKFEQQKKVDGHWCRVIVGSSKFNIKQMNELIETVMRYCAEHEIETEILDI